MYIIYIYVHFSNQYSYYQLEKWVLLNQSYVILRAESLQMLWDVDFQIYACHNT